MAIPETINARIVAIAAASPPSAGKRSAVKEGAVIAAGQIKMVTKDAFSGSFSLAAICYKDFHKKCIFCVNSTGIKVFSPSFM